MSDRFRFRLSTPTPSGNKGARASADWRGAWAKTRKLQKAWAEIIWTQVKLPETPIPRARITIARHGARVLDDDNLRTGCKALVDVLKPAAKSNPFGLGIIAGDAPDQVQIEYRQVKCARKDACTWVEIKPATQV